MNQRKGRFVPDQPLSRLSQRDKCEAALSAPEELIMPVNSQVRDEKRAEAMGSCLGTGKDTSYSRLVVRAAAAMCWQWELPLKELHLVTSSLHPDERIMPGSFGPSISAALRSVSPCQTDLPGTFW